MFTCPAVACEDNQECVDGYCIAQSIPTNCEPSFDGNDGCDEYSLCLDHADADAPTEDYQCSTFPPCPEDGDCPVGLNGAVCSDDFITGNARICLTGLCVDGTDCPTDVTCLDLDGSALGICSAGTFGSPCTEAQDICNEGLACDVLIPGGLGSCLEESTAGGCTDQGGQCVDGLSCLGIPIFPSDCGLTDVCCPQ